MGFRNPFRMSVDKATGVVYLGDYGPDAGTADPNRGPAGQVEFNRITGPATTAGRTAPAPTPPYNECDFADRDRPAPKFNCAGGPTNNSSDNTGLHDLPAGQSGLDRRTAAAVGPPEFGGGSESPMGGPVYRYDPDLTLDHEVPRVLRRHVLRRRVRPRLDQADRHSTAPASR